MAGVGDRWSCNPTTGTFAGASKPAEDDQDQHDNENEAEPASPIIAGPIERAAADSAKASEQRDYEDDEEDSSERHDNFSSLLLCDIVSGGCA